MSPPKLVGMRKKKTCPIAPVSVDNARRVAQALAKDPDEVLTTRFCLYSSVDIINELGVRTNPISMGRALVKAGFMQVASCMPCITHAGQMRLWVIRNVEKEIYSSQTAAGKFYDEERRAK